MIEKILTELKMPGALSYLQENKCDKFNRHDLLQLLKSELELRKNNQQKRKLIQAKFPVLKAWEHLDYKRNPKVPFKDIAINLEGDFVLKKRNLCLVGSQGLGKTHCAIAIGSKMCELGFNVRFFTCINLINQLQEAHAKNELTLFYQKILSPQLLIIDELGFVPLSDLGARLLFEVFAKRYESGSILVTTNLDFPKWIQVFGSKELTAALVDRFIHRCTAYSFDGDSVRLSDNVAENKKIRTLK